LIAQIKGQKAPFNDKNPVECRSYQIQGSSRRPWDLPVSPIQAGVSQEHRRALICRRLST